MSLLRWDGLSQAFIDERVEQVSRDQSRTARQYNSSLVDSAVIGRFDALAKRGYHVTVMFTGDTIECTCIMGGDCNSPYKQFFNPIDGRGFTYVHMDHVPDDVVGGLDDGRDSQAFCDGLFDWMSQYVLSVEGKPR